MHLEDYGYVCIYNAETLEKLIDTIHHMHNITTPNEKLFTGQLNTAYMLYINTHGTQGKQHYAIHSLLYLGTIKEKYFQMYNQFIMQLCMYAKAIHLYYAMKLVTFGIDRYKNLIIKFPVFIQPYTQQPLVQYQIETVLVPIIDQNKQADGRWLLLA